MTDPYAVLGLKHGATKEEAKAKFKALAKLHHPDMNPGDPDAERRFKEIGEAYDKIKDGDKSEQFRFNTDFNFDPRSTFFHFDDLFGDLRRRNSDLHLECRLSLEEVFEGKTLAIQIPSRGGDSRTVTVNIPAGIRHGMRVTVPKGGNQQNLTYPPGDLYMSVNVMPHNRFVRDNVNNLITTAPVTAFDVLLGKSIEVVNIEGKVLTVSVPPGFDSSRKLRLAGQGMPDPFTRVRGDLLVDLFIVYPELTEDQRKLIEQAAELPKANTT